MCIRDRLKAELEKAGITAGSGSFEQGDPNYRDDSLDAYTEFGWAARAAGKPAAI